MRASAGGWGDVSQGLTAFPEGVLHLSSGITQAVIIAKLPMVSRPLSLENGETGGEESLTP